MQNNALAGMLNNLLSHGFFEDYFVNNGPIVTSLV